MKGIGRSRGASPHSAAVARLSRNSGDATRVCAAVRFKLLLDTFDTATAEEEEFARCRAVGLWIQASKGEDAFRAILKRKGRVGGVDVDDKCVFER